MFKKAIMFVFIGMFTVSIANAGLGSVLDTGLDGIKNLLKKLDFQGNYVDDVASTFDEAVQAVKRGADGDAFIDGLRRSYADDINYDDFKKIFDDLIRKANIPVPPRVTNMIAVQPSAVADIKRALPNKLRRAGIGEIRIGRAPFNDAVVQKLNRAADLGARGDSSQKAFWKAWKEFSQGNANRNGYWAFVVDADSKDLDELTKVFKKVVDMEPDATKRVAKLNELLEEAADSAASKGDNSLRRAYDEWLEKCAGTKCI